MNASRASALGGLLALVGSLGSGCGGTPSATPAKEVNAPLVTTPLTALAPAASLGWLLDVQPRALLADAALAPAVRELITEDTFAAIARLYAVDLRGAEEVLLGDYPESRLLLVRAFLDPDKLETAFAARTVNVEGRGIDHEGSPVGRIVRLWGTRVNGERVQMAVFGRQAAGLEVGRFGPLRASEGFALGKLHRASPALATAPLEATSRAAGEAPVRFFVPGPFDDATAPSHGLGGLLGAATAAAVTLTPRARPGERPILELKVILDGAWSEPVHPGSEAKDRPDAATVLLRHFQTLANSAPGKLIGADAMLEPPVAASSSGTLVLTARYDAETLARRLHLALEGPLTTLLSPRAERAD